MAATIDKGTATTPRRDAVAREGRAPTDRAARSQRIHAREPVTKRFGPMSRPTRRANGWCGTRAASRDAAGRLLTSTDVTAATNAVDHTSRCDRTVVGPDQARPRTPSVTATPNSP